MELRKTGKLKDEELSQKVIGAAIEVHRALGPGFLESFYEEALSLELTARSIPFERQFPVSVFYRNQEIAQHRLDLFVDKRLVVELKAISEVDSIHFSTVRSYVKACNASSGIILNFSSMPLSIKRVGTDPHASPLISFS